MNFSIKLQVPFITWIKTLIKQKNKIKKKIQGVVKMTTKIEHNVILTSQSTDLLSTSTE